MKKLFAALFVSATLLAGGARAEGEIVFIDLQEVFKRFYKTQLAQDQLRKQAADIKTERTSMEDEIKALKEDIEVLRTDARNETLSDEVREAKRNKLEEKLVELQKKERDAKDFEKLRSQQLEQQNKRMSIKLFDEIHEAIINYSKEKGYAAVIDRSAQSRAGMQMVLYANVRKDVTADVLAVLNEGREEIPTDQTPLKTIDAEASP